MKLNHAALPYPNLTFVSDKGLTFLWRICIQPVLCSNILTISWQWSLFHLESLESGNNSSLPEGETLLLSDILKWNRATHCIGIYPRRPNESRSSSNNQPRGFSDTYSEWRRRQLLQWSAQQLCPILGQREERMPTESRESSLITEAQRGYRTSVQMWAHTKVQLGLCEQKAQRGRLACRAND